MDLGRFVAAAAAAEVLRAFVHSKGHFGSGSLRAKEWGPVAWACEPDDLVPRSICWR